jgi:YfiH family protein
VTGASGLSLGDCVVADWSAPANVRALTTTRAGGVSSGAFATLNLKLGEDEQASVAENRRRLDCLLPTPPVWLRMEHGTTVVHAESVSPSDERPLGDAMVAHRPGLPCLVTTADCLPVFLCDMGGTCVGVAHAGWRGLCAGVIEQTVAAMRSPPSELLAHLGPAIGPRRFEVGQDVADAFLAADARAADAFKPIEARPGKYLADIYALARQRLRAAGVTRISGGSFCTMSDSDRFFSYRREKISGRMASVIWLA